MKMDNVFHSLAAIIFLAFSHGVHADEKINMEDVRKLAKLSVDEILANAPIENFYIESYWKSVRDRNRPLVVFFYSNKHGPSQRLATLIKYISSDYKNKLAFGRVRVAEKGKPNKDMARMLEKSYSLDDTPGILFYDNEGADMTLEDEDYIDADFKEFRTPSMLLWRAYYKAVRKKLNKLLAD